MKRLEAFYALKTHAWLGKAYGKLLAGERAIAVEFIRKNAALDAGAFEMAVQRMFLDQPKPRNWTIINELLICANTRASR